MKQSALIKNYMVELVCHNLIIKNIIINYFSNNA